MSNSSIKAGERRTINGLRNPSLACVPRGMCGHRQSSCHADVDIARPCLFLAHLCGERALPNVFRARPHTADWGWSAGTKKCEQLPAQSANSCFLSAMTGVSCGGGRGREVGLTTTEYKGTTLPPTHSLPVSETPYLFTSPLHPKGLTPFILHCSQISCLSVCLSPLPLFFPPKIH